MQKSFKEFIGEALLSGDIWEKLKRETRPIWIYGMGNGGDKLSLRLEELGIPYRGFFASDDFVRGQSFHGIKVLKYSEAKVLNPEMVVLVAFGTRLPEVLQQMDRIAEEQALYVPDLPVAGKEYFDCNFVREHLEELEAADALFQENLSRTLYRDLIRYKLSAEYYLLKNTYTAQGKKPKLPLSPTDTVVDAGAYNGDTVREIYEKYPHVHSFIAIEPDKRNFKKLSAFQDEVSGELEIKAINAAVGNKNGTCDFYTSGNRNSNKASTSHETKTVSVEEVTVDALTEKYSVGLIKYDVEGAEKEALEGSVSTVLRCRPSLKVAVYHRSRDLFELPIQVSHMAADYSFYLRRNLCIPAWEADLYAIPKEKEE